MHDPQLTSGIIESRGRWTLEILPLPARFGAWIGQPEFRGSFLELNSEC
jgi:hypothetical protein